MIVVETKKNIVSISENGGEIFEYSPAFIVSTKADGIIQITNMGDGTSYEGAFNEWIVNGKSYPEFPDRISVVLALNKAVKKWIAL